MELICFTPMETTSTVLSAALKMRCRRLCVSLVFMLINLLPSCRISSAASHNTTVNVAWLISEQKYHDVSKASSIGALALAVRKATIITGNTYNITWADPRCNKKDSVIALYRVLVEQRFSPDLLLGPQCSSAMAYVGKLAGFRNLPSFGWVSESFELRPDTYTYNTLVRVLPPINSIGPGLLMTLKHFNWHHVTVISSETNSDHQYEELGEVVIKALDSDDMFTLIRYTPQVKSPPDHSTIRNIFTVTKKEARIVIFCVPFSEMSSWMLVAADMEMADGDFAFIFVGANVPSPSLYQNMTQPGFWRQGTNSDSDIEKAMRSLLILTMKPEDHNLTFRFLEEARDAAINSTSQWIINLNVKPEPSDFYAPYLHDAFLLFTKLSAEARDIGCGYSNGSCILDRAQNRKFDEPDFVTGKIILDSMGDRIPEFWLLDMNNEAQFQVAMNISVDIIDNNPVRELHQIKEISPIPPDIPKCGYQKELCPEYVLYIAVPLAVLVFIGLAIGAFLLYRRYQFEQTIQNMAWKINRKDLHVTNGLEGARNVSLLSVRGRHRGSLGSIKNSSHHHAITKDVDCSSILTNENDQIFINTAKYRNTTVAIKKLINPRLTFDRKFLVEMKHMTDLKHNNLATFIGATTEPPELFEVWEYCSKGSLQDIIWNEAIKLDNMFKFSIIIDILTGLKYLHDSQLKMHGKLKSSNIVVDGRWMCKLTDYGLFKFRDGQQQPDLGAAEQRAFSQLFWMAPELLREIVEGRKLSTSSVLLVKGANKRQAVPMSQEGDIYASAIILKEVITRSGPYTEYEELTPKEIVDRVRDDGANGFTFRPKLSEISDKDLDQVIAVIRSGWSERPSDRPSAQQMLRDIQRINPFKSANVMDNMIRMLERYSNNLEEIVGERTQQVEEEKKKSETLLYRMLPRPVAEKLKCGEKVDAKSFDAVTIYFSDIVQFTNLSAESTPLQVVTLLNGLYTLFDSTCSRHDVYKVETIGDAYMLVSGLPVRNGDRHAVEIANCALELLSGVLNFKVNHKPGHKLQIRIGLHTGPAVSGIVGLTMPRYCLFGSTVSQASSMESGGMPLRIHLSEMTYQLLSKFSGYHLALRGNIEMKGVGLIKSYWLYGRDNFDAPLPKFGDLISADHPKPEILPVTVGEDPKLLVCQDKAESDKSTLIKASNPEVQTLRSEKPIPKYSVKIGANTSPTTGEQSKDLKKKDNNSVSSKKIRSSLAFSTQSSDTETTVASSSPTATAKSSAKTIPSIALAAGTATENSRTKTLPPISAEEDSTTEKLFQKVIRTVSPSPDSPKTGSGADKSVEKFAPITQKSPEKTVAITSTATASASGEEYQEPLNSASPKVVNVKPPSSSIQPSSINVDEHSGEQESQMLPRSNLLHMVQPSEPAAKNALERTTQPPQDRKINKESKVTSANGTTEVKFNFRDFNLSQVPNGLDNHQTTEFKFNLRDLGTGEGQRAGEYDSEKPQKAKKQPLSDRKTSLITEEEARGRTGKNRKKKLWKKSKSTELRLSNRAGMDNREFSSDNAAFIQDSEDNDTSSSDHNTTATKQKNMTQDWAWDRNGSSQWQSDEELKGNHDMHQQRRKHLSKSSEREATKREAHKTSLAGDILGKLKTRKSRKPKNENKQNSVMELHRTANFQMNEDINLNTIGAKAEGADPVNKEPLFYSMSPKSRSPTRAPNSHHLTIPDVTVTDCVD